MLLRAHDWPDVATAISVRMLDCRFGWRGWERRQPTHRILGLYILFIALRLIEDALTGKVSLHGVLARTPRHLNHQADLRGLGGIIGGTDGSRLDVVGA